MALLGVARKSRETIEEIGTVLLSLSRKATSMPTRTALPKGPSKVVLHIGSCKAGSSTIQYFMRDHREQLAHVGHLWPLTPGARRQHGRLGLLIKSDADLEVSPVWRRVKRSEPATFRENVRRKLIREIDQSGLSSVLLSDESLYHQADVAALGRLRQFTDELAPNLRLVVYLRRQDDHLLSYYQQKVRNGPETRRLDEFVREDTSMPYDYAARLRTWERLLKPDEFVVRRFERDSFVSGSLVQDFLDAADVDLQVEDVAQVSQHNESLDAESVEFLRLYNLYRAESEGHAPNWRDNRLVVERLREASTGPLQTLPDQVLDDFMARWEDSNRAVAQRYFEHSAEELFLMPRRIDHRTSEQYLDPARLEHYITLLELPDQIHKPLLTLVEREARVAAAG